MRWRCASDAALRKRDGPDAEVTSTDIVLCNATVVILKVGGLFRNDNIWGGLGNSSLNGNKTCLLVYLEFKSPAENPKLERFCSARHSVGISVI